MFGVILWSDPQSGEAVIWCEDRAGLAYCDDPAIRDTESSRTAGHSARFDAGDLVEFELVHVEGQRLTATNLSAVGETNQDMPAPCADALGTLGNAHEQATLITLDQRRPAPARFFPLSRRG